MAPDVQSSTVVPRTSATLGCRAGYGNVPHVPQNTIIRPLIPEFRKSAEIRVSGPEIICICAWGRFGAFCTDS
jgi:hypothetical protein